MGALAVGGFYKPLPLPGDGFWMALDSGVRGSCPM